MSIKDGGPVRYEISEGELDVLAITGPEGTRYIDGEEIEARAIRQQARDIAELEVFAEIGRQWNSDSSLAKWFPLTAERVEQDAQEIAKLRTDLAAAVAENAALLAANRDCILHFDTIKTDYDAMKLRAEQAEARLAAIDAAPTVGWLRPYGRGLSTSEPSGERMPQYELIARPAKD